MRINDDTKFQYIRILKNCYGFKQISPFDFTIPFLNKYSYKTFRQIYYLLVNHFKPLTSAQKCVHQPAVFLRQAARKIFIKYSKTIGINSHYFIPIQKFALKNPLDDE